MENLSGVFQLTMTDKGGSSAQSIKPNDPCKILINGEIVITGYVDKISPSFDAQSHEIQVSGRDKAGDLVDSSVVGGTGQFKNKTIEEIIRKICEPFEIPVKSNVGTTKSLETFSVDQGATAYETIHKLAKKGGFLVISDGRGGIVLTRTGTEKMTVPLTQGANILAANCDYDGAQMHSQYIVKGQKQGKGTESVKKIAHNKAVVTNEYANRYRPLLIIEDGQADEKSVKDRVKWEATVRAAKAKQSNITVQGWQSGGGLWGINKLVQIDSSYLGVTEEWVISSVNFTLDESGELAKITVTPPEAYSELDDDKIKKKKGKKGKKEKAGKFQWSGD
jgi:prophage tail gpP-like protein